MKKSIMIIAFAIAAASCGNAQKKEFSKEALEGKLTNLDGKEVTFQDIIKQHKGKKVLIEFWASWCGDCVKAMPKIKEVQANNPDVDYVFISADKAMDKWKIGIEKHELKGDHYWINDENGMKGSFGKSVDLDWIPRYIVLDKDGKIKLYRAIETDFDKINAALK